MSDNIESTPLSRKERAGDQLAGIAGYAAALVAAFVVFWVVDPIQWLG